MELTGSLESREHPVFHLSVLRERQDSTEEQESPVSTEPTEFQACTAKRVTTVFQEAESPDSVVTPVQLETQDQEVHPEVEDPMESQEDFLGQLESQWAVKVNQEAED